MNHQTLEIVAKFPAERPGNPTVMPDGRVIVSISAIGGPEISVRTLAGSGDHPAYPDPVWASRPRADGRGMSAVIGIRNTPQGIVWILDLGGPAQQPRLIGWNDRENRLHRLIVLPQNVLRPSSFVQDFVVDWRRQKIHIADMTLNPRGESDYPAIITVDLKTGLASRVLECHASMMPVDFPLQVDGKPLCQRMASGEVVDYRYGINPIAIDPLGHWVYFGSMSGLTVYRIAADLLAEPDTTVSASVEAWCQKPHCDGFDVDAAGNIYVTDIGRNAIGLASPAGYWTLAQDDTLLAWPDGVELDAEGRWLYITTNQLHRHPRLNAGYEAGRPPYHVLRLRVNAPMTSNQP